MSENQTCPLNAHSNCSESCAWYCKGYDKVFPDIEMQKFPKDDPNYDSKLHRKTFIHSGCSIKKLALQTLFDKLVRDPMTQPVIKGD